MRHFGNNKFSNKKSNRRVVKNLKHTTKITSKKDRIEVRSEINKLWTKKDCEQVEYFLQRYEQVLEEAVDLRAQILRILSTRKTDFKNTVKVTERISEATDKFLGSIDNSDD